MPTNVMGFGTMYVGGRDYGPHGSYVTTEFVTAPYAPLVPLRGFRVIETGNSLRWLGPRAACDRTIYRAVRQPLCWAQVGTVYITAALCAVSFALFLMALGSQVSPGPIYGLYSHPVIAMPLMFLCATWRPIVGRVLRARAMTDAGLASWLPRLRPWPTNGLEPDIVIGGQSQFRSWGNARLEERTDTRKAGIAVQR
jgi:hypothetical protein